MYMYVYACIHNVPPPSNIFSHHTLYKIVVSNGSNNGSVMVTHLAYGSTVFTAKCASLHIQW